jgi:AraC family transcriptional regulator
MVVTRYSPLHNTAEFRIGRFDHPPGHRHRDSLLETTPEYSVNRVERGTFKVEIGRQQWELGPGDLFLNYPGMVYRCRHRELVPSDECMTVAYVSSTDPCDEIAAFERAARTQPVLRPSNRLAYLFLQITRLSNEQLAADETAYCIIAETVHQSVPPRRLYREHQLSWYTERVDAVRDLIERHYDTEQRLAKLARSVGMSPFHFARIFRELVGIPPHSYLRRIRLQHAARSLCEGASVTEACFASGFQDLSHFSRQFYRHFGVKASRYARDGGNPQE